jgi:hypothetical protein
LDLRRLGRKYREWPPTFEALVRRRLVVGQDLEDFREIEAAAPAAKSVGRYAALTLPLDDG